MAPYSIITRIKIIIHISSRIVDVGASLGSVMTFWLSFLEEERYWVEGMDEISFLRGVKLILFFVIALTARDVETTYFRYIILM